MAPSMLASSIFLPVMALLLPFSPTIAFHTSPLTSSASSSRLYKSSSPSDSSDESISRREFNAFGFALALGLPAASMNSMYTRTPSDYPLWPLLPVGPYKRKKTIFNTVVPDSIYTLEQKFGILNVQVPIRSTIVALKGGGLFVYDPVAPTKEATAMIDDLVKKHGPVKHVVLGSVAIEHKVYAGIFSQKYPEAAVWVQPGQYAFPNDLPLEFVGFPRGTRMIPSSMDPEVYPEDWKRSGLEYATLGPFISRDGAFGETVFYHGPTKTLLVTDTVVEVSKEVPAIFADDPAPLLYHARDTVSDIVEDSEDVRQRGWMRIVLFGLFFNPKDIDVKETDVALRERRPDINPDFAGIYPWDWVGDKGASSFKALEGGLLVPPILQELILNRNPIETLDFADQVSRWDFNRIIPAHLKGDVKANGAAYRASFSFLEEKGVKKGMPSPLQGDNKLLSDSSVNLIESGAVSAVPPLPGGTVSRQDIIARSAYGCRGGICTPRAK